MSECKIAYKTDSLTGKRKLLYIIEEGVKKFIRICGTSEVGYSLRRSAYECDETTGAPLFQTAYFNGIYLRAYYNGVWNEADQELYNIPEGSPIRLKITQEFIDDYLTDDKEVLGVFWRQFVSGEIFDETDLFNANYALYQVLPENQGDPVTEWGTTMRGYHMKFWVAVGKVLPVIADPTVMTIEKYDVADPLVLKETFTMTGSSGNDLILDASQFLLQDPGDQINPGESQVFEYWGGWITGEEISQPYLEKQYPSDDQTIKLYYSVAPF